MRPLLLSAGTAALLVVPPLTASAQAPGGGRVLVVPFENTGSEPRGAWLGEAAAVLLADALNARGVAAITRPERVRAFDQLNLPSVASLSRATVIKVGQLVGASEVIVGSFSLTGDELSVTAHGITMDVGRLQPAVTERGPLKELFSLFTRLSRRLSPNAAEAADSEPPVSLGAFENYVKGLLAESAAARATFLETAIREHPKFERAKLELWEVRREQDDHAAALAVVRTVSPESRFARRARFRAGVSLLDLKQYDEAFTTFNELLGSASAAPPRDAGAAALYNNLGIVQIQRGGSHASGTPQYFLTKAVEAEPHDPDYQFNLGYAYAIARDHQSAVYWLREAVRRHPADADAHYVLAAALQAWGSDVEAARERELAAQLSSRYEKTEPAAAADRAAASPSLTVPRELERLRLQLEPRPFRAEQTIVNSAQREQRDLASFHLERGRRLYDQEQDREAMTELRRAVYLSPYEAQAHLLIGRIHLRGGRPRDAIDALKISIWSADSAAARVVLGEAYISTGNTDAARQALQAALKVEPENADAKRLLSTLK
jgi:predicted Zn-dependent protease